MWIAWRFCLSTSTSIRFQSVDRLTIFRMNRTKLRVCWAQLWWYEVGSMRWSIGAGWIKLVRVGRTQIESIVMMTVVVIVDVRTISAAGVRMMVKGRHVMWWHLIQRNCTGRNVLRHLMAILLRRRHRSLRWRSRRCRLDDRIVTVVGSDRCIVGLLCNNLCWAAVERRRVWRWHSQTNHHGIGHETRSDCVRLRGSWCSIKVSLSCYACLFRNPSKRLEFNRKNNELRKKHRRCSSHTRTHSSNPPF